MSRRGYHTDRSLWGVLMGEALIDICFRINVVPHVLPQESKPYVLVCDTLIKVVETIVCKLRLCLSIIIIIMAKRYSLMITRSKSRTRESSLNVFNCSITAQKWIDDLRFFYSLNIFVQLCASGVELSSSCLIQELLAFQRVTYLLYHTSCCANCWVDVPWVPSQVVL